MTLSTYDTATDIVARLRQVDNYIAVLDDLHSGGFTGLVMQFYSSTGNLIVEIKAAGVEHFYNDLRSELNAEHDSLESDLTAL